MKKLLAPVMQNKVVNTIVSESSKFYIAHESVILTGGTIGFSIATTAVTLKNAREICNVLDNAKLALANCTSKEQKNRVYAITLKSLAPLVTPIIIFQAATITTAVLAKKQSDKRISELAGALSIAQQAVTYYQNFQKQAEESLGEKKYHKLEKEIAENTVYEASASPVNTKQSDDDQLIYEPVTGQLIWSNPDRLDLSWVKYREALKEADEVFVPFSDTFFDKIGADSSVAAAEVFGYYNEDAIRMDDHLYLEGTKVRVNGKEMSALKMVYYPSVRFFGEMTN